MRLLAVLALLGASEGPSHARVWMVVGASSTSAEGIARAARPLAEKFPGGLIFRTNDCGEKRDVFGWAYRVSESADDAKAALAAIREVVPGAYLKACEVTPRSLLALRVPAVDASITDVPTAVAEDWEDEDRISTAVALPDGRNLVIKRVFKAALLEDPDQGKDQGVWLALGAGKLKALAESCSPAEAFAERDRKLAFQCGDSVAADELMHRVLVFDGDKQVTTIPSCRKPRWTGPDALVCSAEYVGLDGKIRLRAKKVAVGR